MFLCLRTVSTTAAPGVQFCYYKLAVLLPPPLSYSACLNDEYEGEAPKRAELRLRPFAGDISSLRRFYTVL